MIFNKRKPLNLTRGQSLSAVPSKNTVVKTEKINDYEFKLVLPLEYKGISKFFAWLFILPKQRVIVLDPVGSFVWENCNDSNTVSNLIELILQKYKLSYRESELSLLAYIKTLVERGLVVLKFIK